MKINATIKKIVFIKLLLIINLAIGQNIGDYRSNATGNWNTLSSWQYFNGTSWVTPTGTSPQGYPGQFAGTQNVTLQSAHTITFSNTITTVSFPTLTINGVLNLNGTGGSPVFTINTQSIIVTPNLTPSANINFSTKGALTLPSNSTLQVGTGGLIGSCTNNQEIFIGSSQFAVCNGGGSTGINFATLMSSGGTLNAVPTSNTPVCQNQTIALNGTITGTAGTGLTYTWTITNPLGAVSIVNSQNTTISNPISGIYTAKLTCNTTYTSIPFSNEETINVTVNSLPNVSTPSDYTICPNKVQMLTANGADVYSWSSSIAGILFEDSLAQIPYSGTNISVIYVKTPSTATVTVNGTNNITSCSSSDSTVVTILNPAVWNGTEWLGSQNSLTPLVFQGNFISTNNLEGCSCTVSSGNIVFNHNLIIDGAVNVNGGNLQFNNNAYLLQSQSVSNTGNAIVKRNSANMVRLDYTGWSSPVTGQNLFDFTPQTLTNRFYEYNSTSNAYTVVSNVVTGGSGAAFLQGKGYLLRAPNNWSSTIPAAYPGSFVGVLNNGDITPAVSVGFNMIGNPYPSPLNADTFLMNNTTSGVNALYFWSHTIAATNGIYAQNNYASYSLIGGIASNAGGAEPDGIIQVGQGFIVGVTTAGNVNFNNNQRVSSSNGQFFKTTNTIEKHRIWLGLTDSNNSYNQILLGYMTGATNAFDQGIDAILFANNSSISTLINNDKYGIQGRALPFSANDEVPLAFKAQNAGQFTISINNFDGIFLGEQNIFLRDNVLNIVHNIKVSPYTFTSEVGDFASRFTVVYQNGALSIDTPTFTEDSVVVYQSNNVININAGQTTISNVKVYDVRGRLLTEKSKVNATTTSIENASTAQQVLIVQITSNEGVVVSKKVVD